MHYTKCDFNFYIFIMPYVQLRNESRYFLGALLLFVSLYAVSVSAATEQTVSNVAVDSSATASVDSIGPFGGNTWDIAIDPTSARLYAVAKDSPNGFYWSDDEGAQWHGLSGVDYGGSAAVEVSPTDGTVFVVLNGLYRSTDGGENLSKILDDGSETMLYAQDHLMMASNTAMGSIQISADNGDTFSTVSVDSAVSVWWIADGITSGTFYAIGYENDGTEHLYRSTNSGTTWSEISIPSNLSGRVCVNPTDATNIFLDSAGTTDSYYSTDAGSSWTTASGVQSGNCVFDSSGRIYIGDNYSDDKGVTWGEIADDNDGSSRVVGSHAFVIDPNDVNILYGDGVPGVTKSVNRGTSWEDVNTGISGVNISDISQATDKDVVWASSVNGVARTENFTSGDPSWDFPLLQDPTHAIWVKPSDSEIAVVGEIGGIKRTTDGGITWSENVAPDSLTPDFIVGDILQDRLDSDTIYAAASFYQTGQLKTGMVFQSNDAGLTWADMSPTDNASVQSLSQTSTGDIYAAIGAEAGTDNATGIYKYSNGEWTHLSGSPSTEMIKVIVDPEHDNVIYAMASNAQGNGDSSMFGFYLSKDSGETWTKITDGLENFNQLTSLVLQSSTTPNTLYLGVVNSDGQAALYKSSTAGTTWGLLYTGLKDETFATLLFDGVTMGSSRGLLDLTSKTKIILKAQKSKIAHGSKKVVTLTMKDATTNKLLKKKNVKVLKLLHGKFVTWKSVQTNNKGKVTFSVPVTSKNTQFKARWKPNAKDDNEYSLSVSTVLKIKK